jgi:hypothetical protein
MPVPYRAHALVVAAGFFGVFSAFASAQALSTTLSQNKTIANVSLAILYLIFTIICIPAPKLVTHLGPKLSMIIGSAPYALFVLSFLHPGWPTTLTSHALVGVGAPLVWTGQSIYLSRCARENAYVTGTSSEAATSYFNGLFYSLFSVTGFVGTLGSSFILNYAGDNATTLLFIVLSIICGLGVVVFVFTPTITPHRHMPMMTPLDIDTPSLLARHGITADSAADRFSALAAANHLAALRAGALNASATDSFAVDPYAPHDEGTGYDAGRRTKASRKQKHVHASDAPDAETPPSEKPASRLRLLIPDNADDPLLRPPRPDENANAASSVSVVATLSLAFTEPRFFTLIPVIFYHGMSQGFVFGDVTSLLVKPALGAATVPYFLAVYYGCAVVLNYFGGRVAATRFGRRGLTVIACAAHVIFTAWALFWRVPHNFVSVKNPETGKSEEVKLAVPDSGDYVACFLAAFLYAAGDAVYMGQIPAILQSFFATMPRDSDAAMSGLKLFQSLGTSIQFALGFFLEHHYQAKAGAVFAMHLLGVVGMAVLDCAVQPLDAHLDAQHKGGAADSSDVATADTAVVAASFGAGADTALAAAAVGALMTHGISAVGRLETPHSSHAGREACASEHSSSSGPVAHRRSKSKAPAPVSSAVSGDVAGRAFQGGAVGQVAVALPKGRASARYYGED